ncbi:DEAD/DEAH box helicase family protein [Bacillus cereus]|uniref:DEAD/DEAH box helicase n=1 Tax=Bacillus cereus TaxID=1396 RepID=UPI00191D6217|nr:DEAD/DEAH box helicase family protein [Bacillus cereus]QQU31677.1 DEAD/DEAH box helicase family protein [Bacillus cereus]
MKYLGQVLTKDDKHTLFKKNGLNLCVAPTGSGKTYLIVDEMKNEYKSAITPFGMKRVLLLVNRSALLEQYLKAIDEKFMETFEEHGYYVYRDCVHVYSYQTAQRKIERDEHFLSNFDLILMDEAHYFLQDSWNGTTDDVFARIIERSKDIPCTMFTATPEELMDYTKIREIPMELIDYSDKLGFNERIECIATNKDFNDIINGIPLTEKFILFVNSTYSKKKIGDLAEKLSNDSRCVGFYHSKWNSYKGRFEPIEKMKAKYQNLVELHKFNENGAVANSAIDNGVDFKDEDLKHIILLDQYDPVTMKQMIGRKRFNINNADDKLKVWVVNTDKAFLDREKERSLSQITLYEAYKNLSGGDFIELYGDRLKYAKLSSSLENKTANELTNNIEKHESDDTVPCVKVEMCRVGEDIFSPVFTVNFCLVSKSYYRLNYLNCLLNATISINDEMKKLQLHKAMEQALLKMRYTNVRIEHKNTYHEHLEKKQTIAENMERNLIPFLEGQLGKNMNKDTFAEFKIYMFENFGVKNTKGQKPGTTLIGKFLEEHGYSLSKNRKLIGDKQETCYSVTK